jgi:Spy/CpxP family protein refolding chaperone
MLSRTVLCLLSIAMLGSAVVPSFVLAAPVELIEISTNNKDNNEKLYEQLNLSASQIQKVRVINDQFEPQILNRRQSIIAAKNELQSLESSQANKAQIRSKQQQIKQLRQELVTIRKKYATAMQSVLSAEQWSKLQRLMKERRAQRNEE